MITNRQGEKRVKCQPAMGAWLERVLAKAAPTDDEPLRFGALAEACQEQTGEDLGLQWAGKTLTELRAQGLVVV